MARNKHPEETVDLILSEALKLFIEKGYDNTSIQDIINNLGGLSKGAIYHHFKSKDEIFEAVCQKIGHDNTIYYDKIRDDKSKNGYEKLKAMTGGAYLNPHNDAVIAMMGKFLSDPRFLKNHILEMYELIAPRYLQPIIEQGIQDGSIKTDYPKELAEVLITLFNVWINPVIVKSTPLEMRRKLEFLSSLLNGLGIDIFDSNEIERYEEHCRKFTDGL